MITTITSNLLVTTLFICSVSVGQKLPSQLNPKDEINECQTCKVLTDSFSHWLGKTSRGKFEGGDAAWEAAKLKSYARSEIRLVEIQEGLCSEVKKHQDRCYGLSGETEQTIEKWWFHEDLNIDLYTWLCIETLKHCCPSQHFGENCTLCPLDKNNKICGSNGRCDGEGTRKGTGKCICKRGYMGTLCKECARNYYRENADTCKPCHLSCDGCSGAGAEACHSCAAGWQLESGLCVDIDECTWPDTCQPNQYCVNLEGTHSCKQCHQSCKACIAGTSSNCTSCEPRSILWSGSCFDDKRRIEILTDSLRRIALYLGLLVILYIVFRLSRWLSSFFIIIIAIYVYVSERHSQMSIADVILFNIASQAQ